MINTAKLTFASGWLGVEYIQTIHLPDAVTPATDDVPETTTPGGVQEVILQSTSYHPTSLALIQADCEKHGVTIDGDDAESIAEWVASYVPPPPTPLTGADFEAALDAHLDTTAQQRRYTDRFTCALRAGYDGLFRAEGQAFASWMDTCNAMAYVLMAEVQAGTRPLPATTQELIDALPAMEWPSGV